MGNRRRPTRPQDFHSAFAHGGEQERNPGCSVVVGYHLISAGVQHFLHKAELGFAMNGGDSMHISGKQETMPCSSIKERHHLTIPGGECDRSNWDGRVCHSLPFPEKIP